MRLAFLFFFSLCFIKVTATGITGRNKEYAGKTLQFYQYSDPVTGEKTPAFTIDVDEDGYFNSSPSIEKTIFTFCEFGIYKGNLFLEPNQNIELLLPPLREKSFAEKKNPYFSPVEFWFATAEGNMLNDDIAAMENLLGKLSGKFFNQLYYQRSRSAFDSVQVNLNSQLSADVQETFIMHKNLRLKTIEADAFRLSADKISTELLKTDPSDWTNPAFIDLFNKAFAGKLSYAVKTSGENRIPKAIAEGNIAALHSFIEQNYATEGSLTPLALLKMLHDAYYSGEFNHDKILNLLNNIYFTANKNKNIPVITNNVIQKLTHLRKGTKAPAICLKNINGNPACTTHDNGKYKYLLFADTEMTVVREQLKYLTRISELFSKHLEIYVILRKTDLIEMKRFMIEEKIPGVHLVDENSKYIEQYKVKSYPASFLLNSNHEVVFGETKAPLDGFEQQFGQFIRNELFMQQRNQSR